MDYKNLNSPHRLKTIKLVDYDFDVTKSMAMVGKILKNGYEYHRIEKVNCVKSATGKFFDVEINFYEISPCDLKANVSNKEPYEHILLYDIIDFEQFKRMLTGPTLMCPAGETRGARCGECTCLPEINCPE